jgi:hypothetical protein
MPFVNKNASNGGSTYSKVSLDEFSDDEGDDVNGLEGRWMGRGNGASNGGHPGVNDSLGRQQQLFAEQDQGLEMLGQSAERLGKMSMAIHEELGFQNKMLDEMEADLNEAGENLDFVTRKTKEFIEKSGGTKNFVIILALIAIAIVLFLLILYT